MYVCMYACLFVCFWMLLSNQIFEYEYLTCGIDRDDNRCGSGDMQKKFVQGM